MAVKVTVLGSRDFVRTSQQRRPPWGFFLSVSGAHVSLLSLCFAVWVPALVKHCWFEVFIHSGGHSAESFHVLNNFRDVSVLETERS